MNVYVLIDSADGEAEVDVFADRDEAIATAGIRAEEPFNRYREDKLSAAEISRVGSLTHVEVGRGHSEYSENFGLNQSMIANGLVWFCHTYDDGNNYLIVERKLNK